MTHVVRLPVTAGCFEQEELSPLTDAAYDWAERHAGPQAYQLCMVSHIRGWCMADHGNPSGTVEFHFYSKDVALLFKLTWGGV